MPADSPMVLVPREPTEAMMRAWNEAVPDAAEPPHADGWTPPADTTFRARWQAALSASPARGEGDAPSRWSAVRNLFVRHAEAFNKATRYEEASAIADKAGREIEELFAPSTTSTAEQVGASEASAPNPFGTGLSEPRMSAPDMEAVAASLKPFAPSPGEGDAPVAWRYRTTLTHPAGESDWAYADRRPTFPCAGFTAEPLFVRPTPATPEGLREKVEIALDWLSMAESAPKVGHSDVLRYPPICQTEIEALKSILAALQPQAEGE